MPTRTLRKLTIVAAVAFALALSAAGCGRSASLLIPEGGAYTFSQVNEMARGQDISSYEDRPVSEAGKARNDALVELRKEGDLGKEAADLLTKNFPSDARSVPIRVEPAKVDGKDAWIVIEVWGPPGGKLESLRLWVFDRASGKVLRSNYYR